MVRCRALIRFTRKSARAAIELLLLIAAHRDASAIFYFDQLRALTSSTTDSHRIITTSEVAIGIPCYRGRSQLISIILNFAAHLTNEC